MVHTGHWGSVYLRLWSTTLFRATRWGLVPSRTWDSAVSLWHPPFLHFLFSYWSSQSTFLSMPDTQQGAHFCPPRLVFLHWKSFLSISGIKENKEWLFTLPWKCFTLSLVFANISMVILLFTNFQLSASWTSDGPSHLPQKLGWPFELLWPIKYVLSCDCLKDQHSCCVLAPCQGNWGSMCGDAAC